MDYATFLGTGYDNITSNQLFMFISRDEVVPYSVGEARVIITYSTPGDGYNIIWKFLKSYHPNLRSNKRSLAWPKYTSKESLRTFILCIQSHASEEYTKGRVCGNMEILNVIYDNLPEIDFPKTRHHIEKKMEKYDDSEPSKIPEKWTVNEFDTTINLYAENKEEPSRSSHPTPRLNNIQNDKILGGYDT